MASLAACPSAPIGQSGGKAEQWASISDALRRSHDQIDQVHPCSSPSGFPAPSQPHCEPAGQVVGVGVESWQHSWRHEQQQGVHPHQQHLQQQRAFEQHERPFAQEQRYGQPDALQAQHHDPQQCADFAPQQPAGRQPHTAAAQAPGYENDCSSTVLGVHMPPGGWFKKCRGCGTMTVHEIQVEAARVPFCMRCKARVGPQPDEGLWASLIYVHDAWSAAGV